MISIKDFAKQENVSYEAIRQQVKRYEKELQGHLVIEGKKKLLDDTAVEFLKNKRTKTPIIIQQRDYNAEIDELKQQNENLLLKIAQLQDDLIKEKDQVKLLQNEKIEMLTERNDIKKKHWWQR